MTDSSAMTGYLLSALVPNMAKLLLDLVEAATAAARVGETGAKADADRRAKIKVRILDFTNLMIKITTGCL